MTSLLDDAKKISKAVNDLKSIVDNSENFEDHQLNIKRLIDFEMKMMCNSLENGKKLYIKHNNINLKIVSASCNTYYNDKSYWSFIAQEEYGYRSRMSFMQFVSGDHKFLKYIENIY